METIKTIAAGLQVNLVSIWKKTPYQIDAGLVVFAVNMEIGIKR